MNENKILKKYLLPVMLQIMIVALITATFRSNGIKLGYESAIGVILIILSGMSSALWGIVYQCRCEGKRFTEIIKDFINIRQSMKSYLLVVIFLLFDFGGVILTKGFRLESIWFPILLFLKAIAFGGIEEIGWRYTFQPAMERKITYIPAVFLTFVCWGIWHFLFFYIDGSIRSVNVPFFLLGLLTNCFILSALYAYSGSLWICVMTHALINALSQIAVDDNAMISIALKIVCMGIAVVLYNKTTSCHRLEDDKMITGKTIHAERDSVCMGDDCNAPNARELNYASNEYLSEFMDSVAKYVPSMKNVVWSVACKDRTIAYLIFDENEEYKYELAVPDMKVSELDGKKIYCRYYHKGTLFDYKVQPPIELYPECKTLLDKVKAYEKSR